MTYAIYNIFVVLFLPLVLFGVLLRWRKRVVRHGLAHWRERWGRLSSSQRNLFAMGHRWWWCHAAALGEVRAIESLLRRTPSRTGVKVLLSVVTPEALEWARSHHVADQIIAAPLDLPWVVRRVFRAVRPEWFMTVESEFWPNLLREAHASGARVALINGRISNRSYRRYRWIRPLLQALWRNIDVLAVREQQDAERFAGLGVVTSKIHIVGHLKYDVAVEPSVPPSGAPPTVVLGSTRAGEEALLWPSLSATRERHPGLRLVIAPRHIERAPELQKWLRTAGVEAWRLSEQPDRAMAAGDTVLWDTMGQLMTAYRMADVAVMGGSFAGKGGQNPIEPAALGRPVVFGPSMDNFREIAAALLANGGARQAEANALADLLSELLFDASLRRRMGDQALATVRAAQGATERTLDLLEGWV